MRIWLVALVLVVGCSSVEPARHPRRRDPIDFASLPDVASAPRPAPTVQQAQNAVLYCKEAWDANVFYGVDSAPAARRLAKALRDLDAVKAGAVDVALEGPGGFPGGAWLTPIAWVSGYHRDGAYVPGHPPVAGGVVERVALASMDEAIRAALTE